MEGVPAHVYQGLRDQLQSRLVSVAEERGRLGSEVHVLQQTVADRETTVIGLQQENSWAENGAMSVEVLGVVRSAPMPQPPSSVSEWERDLAEALAHAERVVGGGREPEETRRTTRGRSPQAESRREELPPTGA